MTVVYKSSLRWACPIIWIVQHWVGSRQTWTNQCQKRMRSNHCHRSNSRYRTALSKEGQGGSNSTSETTYHHINYKKMLNLSMVCHLNSIARLLADGQEMNMKNSLKVRKIYHKDFQISHIFYSAKFVWKRLEKSWKIYWYSFWCLDQKSCLEVL